MANQDFGLGDKMTDKALDRLRKGLVRTVDPETGEVWWVKPRKLSRHEQLQALADSGVDTWEDYRGEK